jgi:hypothetical protein
LRQHFKSDDQSPDPSAPPLTTNLPPHLKEWDATAKLADYQLKIGLNYLNSSAPRELKTVSQTRAAEVRH